MTGHLPPGFWTVMLYCMLLVLAGPPHLPCTEVGQVAAEAVPASAIPTGMMAQARSFRTDFPVGVSLVITASPGRSPLGGQRQPGPQAFPSELVAAGGCVSVIRPGGGLALRGSATPATPPRAETRPASGAQASPV